VVIWRFFNNLLLTNESSEVDLGVTSIDYRCEDRKKVGELRGDLGAIGKLLTPSNFRKPRSSPPENEPFS
jgi:hypothetical protein